MTTRELMQWYLRGRADHRDRMPCKRAPRVPESELYAADWAAPAVKAYWDGFNGGVMDAANAIFRQASASRKLGNSTD